MTAQDPSQPDLENPDTLITPEQAIALQRDGALLIDVRSPQGRAQDGLIDGAVPVAKSEAARVLDPLSDARLPELTGTTDQEIVVFCGSERGSDPIISRLREYGYHHVHQIDGGVARWREEGHPTSPAESPAQDAPASA